MILTILQWRFPLEAGPDVLRELPSNFNSKLRKHRGPLWPIVLHWKVFAIFATMLDFGLLTVRKVQVYGDNLNHY